MTRKRIGVALLGAGMVGRAHAHALRALRELAEAASFEVALEVVADAHRPFAQAAQDRYGFARVATSWEEVVGAPGVDAAYVALPNHQHRRAVEAFVAAGYRNSPAFELVGSRGAFVVDLERPTEFQFFDAVGDDDLGGFRRVVTGPRHPHYGSVVTFPVAGVGHGYREAYVAQALDFMLAVAGGAPFTPTFEDGYAVAVVDEAVQLSAARGARVQIDEVAAAAERESAQE